MEVSARIRQDGFSRAEQAEDAILEKQAYQSRCNTGQQCREQASSRHSLGFCRFSGSERAGDEITGTVAEKEGDGLDDSHIGEHDADSSDGLCVETAYKIGVCHIVEARHQHTHYGRNGKAQNQLPDRPGRHLDIFAFSRVHFDAKLQNKGQVVNKTAFRNQEDCFVFARLKHLLIEVVALCGFNWTIFFRNRFLDLAGLAGIYRTDAVVLSGFTLDFLLYFGLLKSFICSRILGLNLTVSYNFLILGASCQNQSQCQK